MQDDFFVVANAASALRVARGMNNEIFVGDRDENKIQVFNSFGNFLREFFIVDPSNKFQNYRILWIAQMRKNLLFVILMNRMEWTKRYAVLVTNVGQLIDFKMDTSGFNGFVVDSQRWISHDLPVYKGWRLQ